MLGHEGTDAGRFPVVDGRTDLPHFPREDGMLMNLHVKGAPTILLDPLVFSRTDSEKGQFFERVTAP